MVLSFIFFPLYNVMNINNDDDEHVHLRQAEALVQLAQANKQMVEVKLECTRAMRNAWYVASATSATISIVSTAIGLFKHYMDGQKKYRTTSIVSTLGAMGLYAVAKGLPSDRVDCVKVMRNETRDAWYDCLRVLEMHQLHQLQSGKQCADRLRRCYQIQEECMRRKNRCDSCDN